MIVKIKNNTEVNQTWVGQLIYPGDYYTIQQSEIDEWAHNSILLADIILQKAVVNDGIQDISPSNGVEYLKGLAPKEVITSQTNQYCLQNDATMFTCSKGSTVSDLFKLENHVFMTGAEDYSNKWLLGGYIFTDNGSYGDYATFQIVDQDNLLGYGAGFVLKEYIKKVYVHPDYSMKLNALAPGCVPIGMYLKCIFTARDQGTGDVEIFINYILFTKEESEEIVEIEDVSSSSGS